jgi:hypothetical protein
VKRKNINKRRKEVIRIIDSYPTKTIQIFSNVTRNNCYRKYNYKHNKPSYKDNRLLLHENNMIIEGDK